MVNLQYAETSNKLLEVFAVRALTAESPITPASPVVINAVNPGLCHSGFSSNFPGPLWAFMVVFKFLLAKSTEEGSMALVCGAGGGPETHGQFMNNCEVKPPAPLVLNKDGIKAQARVWDEL